MTKVAFITGASSGIGKATARLFAKNKINIVICGRRLNKLNELKDELKKLAKVYVLNFDVRSQTEVQRAIASLPEEFKHIDILINNAGNAHGLQPIQQGSIEDWDAMIDGNIKGLLYVSRAIIPQMTQRNQGFIVNIGSIAAKEVYLNGNVYCATKFAVNALNKGMRIDLNKYKIRVCAIHPGLVETEFSDVRFKGNTAKAKAVYQGYKALQAKDIADIIYFVVTRPYYVNIEDLVVYPLAQASPTILNKDS
ncbi:MAG: SDR family NAD(P)-dependent oxidoreductase [Tenacibaculum sp.]